MSSLKIVGLDIESKRKGSDWSQGTYNFRDMICGDIRVAGRKHRFLPFDFSDEEIDAWAEPLRETGLLIVGHNVRRYDLPGVNATLIERGLRPIVDNLVSDTLSDGPRGDGWMRRDLATMAARYGITAKTSINQAEWELAYYGNVAMRQKIEAYNKNDVDVSLALQVAMREVGHLSAPKRWA